MIGAIVQIKNDSLGIVVGRRMEYHFLDVRRILSKKGKCSDLQTIHISNLRIIDIELEKTIEVKTLGELKEKYPEVFV